MELTSTTHSLSAPSMANPVGVPYKLTPEKQAKLLDLLEQTGNLSASAAAVGVTGRAVYALMAREPEFRKRVEDAREKACLKIEQEMIRRGLTGIERGVFYKGERVATEREYSDKLLLALAKANMPSRYAERSVAYVQNNFSVDDTGQRAKERLAHLLGVDDQKVIEGEIIDRADDEN